MKFIPQLATPWQPKTTEVDNSHRSSTLECDTSCLDLPNPNPIHLRETVTLEVCNVHTDGETDAQGDHAL